MKLHAYKELKGLNYLASPYSKYKEGLDQAFVDICRVGGRLIEHGVHLYCPIAHTHPIAKYGKLDPLNHDLWLDLDETIMEFCVRLLIVTMEGWDVSYGIGKEIEFFRRRERQILYVNPQTLMISNEV